MKLDLFLFHGTVEFFSKITISASFTAECAENAEASENPNVDWNVLKLCALGDLRGDKSLGFRLCPFPQKVCFLLLLSRYRQKGQVSQ